MIAPVNWPVSLKISGGSYDLPMFVSSQPRPVTGGITTAIITSEESTIRATTASRCWRKRRRTSCQNVRTGVASISAASASASSRRRRSMSSASFGVVMVCGLPREGERSVLDPRVDDAVQDIGKQVAKDDGEATHHHEGEHEWVVALHDGQHAQLAEPWPREDRLRDHRAGQESGDAQSEQRDDRDQRIAERVLERHPRRGEALRLCGADVVLVEHLEHLRAH